MTKDQFDYYFELSALLFTLILLISAVVMMIRKPQKYSLKNPRATIRSGIFIILFTVAFNSAKENRWDLGYILAFMCMMKVHHDNYLRTILLISYFPTMWGCLQLLFTRIGILKPEQA